MFNTRIRTSYLGRGFAEMPVGQLLTKYPTGFGYEGYHPSSEPRHLQEYYKTPVIIRKMNGNGLLSGISKFFSWIKPVASKAWEVFKNIIPKADALIPKIGEFGEKVFDAVKKKDGSKISELFNQGSEIGKEVIKTGKEGYKSIKEILEHNRKMKELGDKSKNIDIAKQTINKQNTDAMEKIKAQGDIIASKVEAIDPDKTVVTDVTGNGLISRLLKKNAKRLQGRGFKLIR